MRRVVLILATAVADPAVLATLAWLLITDHVLYGLEDHT